MHILRSVGALQNPASWYLARTSRRLGHMQTFTPSTVPAPFGRYVHGIEIPAGARIVITSGQLGLTRTGEVPADAEAQAQI